MIWLCGTVLMMWTMLEKTVHRIKDASVCGSNPAVIEEVSGRNAVRIKSDGSYGSSFLKLPRYF